MRVHLISCKATNGEFADDESRVASGLRVYDGIWRPESLVAGAAQYLGVRGLPECYGHVRDDVERDYVGTANTASI